MLMENFSNSCATFVSCIWLCWHRKFHHQPRPISYTNIILSCNGPHYQKSDHHLVCSIRVFKMDFHVVKLSNIAYSHSIKVPHKRLCEKLSHYGIRGRFLQWICGFYPVENNKLFWMAVVVLLFQLYQVYHRVLYLGRYFFSVMWTISQAVCQVTLDYMLMIY